MDSYLVQVWCDPQGKFKGGWNSLKRFDNDVAAEREFHIQRLSMPNNKYRIMKESLHMCMNDCGVK